MMVPCNRSSSKEAETDVSVHHQLLIVSGLDTYSGTGALQWPLKSAVGHLKRWVGGPERGKKTDWELLNNI